MRRSATTLAKQIQPLLRLTHAAQPTPWICQRCQASLVQSRPRSRHRTFTTSAARRSESVQKETFYDFFRDVLPHGPPPKGPFAVDTKALRKQMLQMQASAHPDHHPDHMKRRAEALSARISEAYRTLSDPLLRTQYLLHLRGIDVAEDETAKTEDQDLLALVLESQEEIEDAETEKDLKPLEQTNNDRLDKSIGKLEAAFEKDDIDAAKKEAVRLKYWTNIRDGIRDFEPGKPVTLIH